jgi:PIN domain nuclease of toxin-antitoxin system
VKVLLDTHVWVWWLTQSGRLTRDERSALSAGAERGSLYLSAISLWEAQMLNARRRIELPAPFASWLVAASSPEIVNVVPLDAEIVIALDSLPAGLQGDPADRLIAATARCRDLPLATYDKTLRRSRAVTLWKA